MEQRWESFRTIIVLDRTMMEVFYDNNSPRTEMGVFSDNNSSRTVVGVF